MFKLLSSANPKTLKSVKKGYLTFILHLAPSDLSGYDTCPKATHGCRLACLNTAGRGGMFKAGEVTNVIQKARIRKTRYFFEDRNSFLIDLVSDITKAIKYAEARGFTPVFRLNGTSDISWEKYKIPGTDTNIFQLFPDYQFYDYTKVLNRKVNEIVNYHLTFSRAENNQGSVLKAISHGYNIAVVFKTKQLPSEYLGLPVINADDTDLRFLDPKGSISGLYAKGKAKKDTSGFVV